MNLLRYWLRVFSRAGLDTIAFFGFNWRTLVTAPTIFAVAIGLLPKYGGQLQIVEQVRWAIVIIQATGFTICLTFLLHLVGSPFRIGQDERARSSKELNFIKVERDLLEERLNSGVTLLMRRMGAHLLALNKGAWSFDVTIINTSTEKPIGISSVLLQFRGRGETVKNIRPTTGEVISEFSDRVPSGDLDNSFLLQPAEPLTGTLLFVNEREFYEEDDEPLTTDDADIVLLDNLGKEYRFPIDPTNLTWR